MQMRMWVIGSLLLAGCWTSTQSSSSAKAPEPAPDPYAGTQPVPVKVDTLAPPPVIEPGDPNGVEGGVEGGVIGGDLDGNNALPPPPPPPPPQRRQRVAPTALEAGRIAGSKQIEPDAPLPPGLKFAAKFDMCIDTNGAVSEASVVVSTGVPAYDAKIVSTLRREWRYHPFFVNGKLAPVCTTLTFIRQ